MTNVQCRPIINLSIRVAALVALVAFAMGSEAFVIEVNTSNPGISSTNQFTLPLSSSFAYDFTVNWGDGDKSVISGSSSPTHTYAASGTYDISITENVVAGFPAIYFNAGGDCLKLTRILSWGQVRWSSMNGAFAGCAELTSAAVDGLNSNTGNVTDFSYAFSGCSSLSNFTHMDTANGTNFSHAWSDCGSLTTFPVLNTAKGTDFSYAWNLCSGLSSFPLLDTGACTELACAWYDCSGLTSFPRLNTSNCTDLRSTWTLCTGLTPRFRPWIPAR